MESRKIFKRYSLIVFCLILFFFLFSYFFPREASHIETVRPNVLLITIDALRPDHLGCYGYKRKTSPYIDKIAREGAVSTQAISQIPETQSSVASFFTSGSPARHYRNYPENWTYLNPLIPSLARILKKNDYFTGVFTEAWQVLRIEGFKEDFDTYFQAPADNPAELTKRSIQWLRKNKDKNFFLYLHYLGAHSPYSLSLP